MELTKAQEQALSAMEQREYEEKVIRLVRADEAPLGAFLMHPYVNECYGRITRLCKNPHYGWIGFELNDSGAFRGWYQPADRVRIA